MSVTKTRSCTKGSVFLINYSLTILFPSAWHSQNDFHLFSFSLSLSPFHENISYQAPFSERSCYFAGGEWVERSTEIIIYSYYEFPHKFHYTYFVYFSGVARGFSGLMIKVILVNQRQPFELAARKSTFVLVRHHREPFFRGCCGWRWVLKPISKIYRAYRTLQ